MITHLHPASDLESDTHLSRLLHYVSAYEPCPERTKALSDDIESALSVANQLGEVQIVSQDGECSLHVHPNGYISVMFPIKVYKLGE